MYRKIFAVILLELAIVPTGGLCENQISSDTIKKCLEATVVVVARHGETLHIGSGFLWREKRHVITAWHLVAGAEIILVESRYGDETFSSFASVTQLSKEADLANLELEEPLDLDYGRSGPRRPLTKQTDTFSLNEELYVFGAPLQVRKPDHTKVETKTDNEGMEALSQRINPNAEAELISLGFPKLDLLVLNLEGFLKPGHSGGAVVNKAGEVVGIGNGGLGDGRGWAVPASCLDSFVTYQGGEDSDLWSRVESLYGIAEVIEQTPLPLIARFEASKLRGIAPMDIAFIDRSQGSPTKWLWDFDDGGSNESDPIHSYTKPTYSYNSAGACWYREPLTVTLTVWNENGEKHTTSLLGAVDLKPRQVQLHLQVMPSKLSNVVYAEKLPSNSRGCGTISLAKISTEPGHYYIGQEVGLQVGPQATITENGQQVTYVFDRWSGWPFVEERVIDNGSRWAMLRITKEMPDGITIMAHYKKKPYSTAGVEG